MRVNGAIIGLLVLLTLYTGASAGPIYQDPPEVRRLLLMATAGLAAWLIFERAQLPWARRPRALRAGLYAVLLAALSALAAAGPQRFPEDAEWYANLVLCALTAVVLLALGCGARQVVHRFATG